MLRRQLVGLIPDDLLDSQYHLGLLIDLLDPDTILSLAAPDWLLHATRNARLSF